MRALALWGTVAIGGSVLVVSWATARVIVAVLDLGGGQ